MDESGEMIDLTGLSDTSVMTDAELAEKLQMEELETLHQSDFEVARHLQAMERQNASLHLFPELFMLGESMRRSNSDYRAEARRCRPPRPPPPRPPQLPRTSGCDELDACEPSTDNPSDDGPVDRGHQGDASASAAASSRFNSTRRAQLAMNRNRRDPVAPQADAFTEPEQNSVEHGDAAAASQDIRSTRSQRLREAMNRNHSVLPAPLNIPVADGEQSRTVAYRTRGRYRWTPPVPVMPPEDDMEESRDALNHNHLDDTTAPITPPTDATGDAEQQDGIVAPPVPPRRQRRPHRHRRMQGPAGNSLGFLQFSMRPIADYHETLEMPGWAPVRRHYEYSRMLDEDDGSGNNYDALWALSERIGDATNKGLNLVQITRLPTMKYQAPSSSTVTSDDMTCDDAVSSSSSSDSMSDATLAAMETVCRVCLCDFENGEVLRSLPCCHRFHVNCIDQWIKQNAICPVCRDSIKDHLNGGEGRGGGGGGGGDHWNEYQ